MRFALVDEATRKPVFSGPIECVMAVDGTEQLWTKPAKNYAKTAVYRMDFSGFATPGTYRVSVDGVGCSYPFEIDLHGGVIIVQHLALGRLAAQFAKSRLDPVGDRLHDFPLRRGRQRQPQAVLQAFEPVKRHAGAILEQRHHRPGARVGLGALGGRGRRGGEDLAAQVAAQALQLPDGGGDGRLAGEANDGGRLGQRIEFARFALGAALARHQRRVRHRDALGAGVIGRPAPAMTRLAGFFGGRFGWPALRRWLARLAGLAQRVLEHPARLLAGSAEDRSPCRYPPACPRSSRPRKNQVRRLPA